MKEIIYKDVGQIFKRDIIGALRSQVQWAVDFARILSEVDASAAGKYMEGVKVAGVALGESFSVGSTRGLGIWEPEEAIARLHSSIHTVNRHAEELKSRGAPYAKTITAGKLDIVIGVTESLGFDIRFSKKQIEDWGLEGRYARYTQLEDGQTIEGEAREI